MKEASNKLLDKAARAIHAAEQLLHGGDTEFAVGRAYYAMFYVAEALLNEKDSASASTEGFMVLLESISSKLVSLTKNTIDGCCRHLIRE